MLCPNRLALPFQRKLKWALAYMAGQAYCDCWKFSSGGACSEAVRWRDGWRREVLSVIIARATTLLHDDNAWLVVKSYQD